MNDTRFQLGLTGLLVVPLRQVKEAQATTWQRQTHPHPPHPLLLPLPLLLLHPSSSGADNLTCEKVKGRLLEINLVRHAAFGVASLTFRFRVCGATHESRRARSVLCTSE